MTHLSERQRVQHLVVCEAVAVLIDDIIKADGHDPDTADRCRDIRRHLDTARAEIQDRDPVKAQKLARRVRRVREAVFHPLLGADFGALIIAARHLIEGLIHEGWIAINDGGHFDSAWSLLIDMIARSPEYDLIDDRNRRGQATALVRLMRRTLADTINAAPLTPDSERAAWEGRTPRAQFQAAKRRDHEATKARRVFGRCDRKG